MKKLSILSVVCLLLSIVISGSAFSNHHPVSFEYFNEILSNIDKVVYGDDNRVLVGNYVDEKFKKFADSTAALIPRKQIIFRDGFAVVNNKTLMQELEICEDEQWANISAIAMCSGFLVGEDLLATAGHCVMTQKECEENVSWVFDYRADIIGDGSLLYLPKENVYHCKEIVERKLNEHTEVRSDFAIIRLDRAVVGRDVLKVRTEGKIEDGSELVIIGHPSGLPTIIADGANVRDNDAHYFFSANLDSFGGNSGSAVFNRETGLVEGILVRGERDYILDKEKKCYHVNKCSDDECRGEDVSRITAINTIAPFGKAWLEPIPNEDNLKPYNPWPFPFPFSDFYILNFDGGNK